MTSNMCQAVSEFCSKRKKQMEKNHLLIRIPRNLLGRPNGFDAVISKIKVGAWGDVCSKVLSSVGWPEGESTPEKSTRKFAHSADCPVRYMRIRNFAHSACCTPGALHMEICTLLRGKRLALWASKLYPSLLENGLIQLKDDKEERREKKIVSPQ